MSDVRLSVLVLTEDSAKDAHHACAAAAKHALQIVDPDTATHRVKWEPASDDAASAVHANRWKSRQVADQRARTRLVRTIATKLLEQPPGFVLFHHDGDVPWSGRPSPHAAAFAEQIAAPVRLLAEAADAEDVDRALRRLHVMVPHYSIEAWAYQNLARVRDLLAGDAAALALVDAWTSDRAALDEVDKPKEALPLRDEHNAELLDKGWPRDLVYGKSPSFTAFCDDLRRDEDLTTALRATWDDPAA